MATRRFSSEELYRLRNDIPIDTVIKNALDIPWQISEGSFRFLCPLCNEFNTAVNPATNLARCFRCGKNFNTIDLVMVITQSDFVNSIRFLKDYQQKKNRDHIRPIKPNAKAPELGLEHLGNVLQSILPPPASIPPSCESGEKSCYRLLRLEKKLDDLTQRIEEIARSLS